MFFEKLKPQQMMFSEKLKPQQLMFSEKLKPQLIMLSLGHYPTTGLLSQYNVTSHLQYTSVGVEHSCITQTITSTI
jgi:hypothetical protein